MLRQEYIKIEKIEREFPDDFYRELVPFLPLTAAMIGEADLHGVVSYCTGAVSIIDKT
jgi:hypothetical protein